MAYDNECIKILYMYVLVCKQVTCLEVWIGCVCVHREPVYYPGPGELPAHVSERETVLRRGAEERIVGRR